MVWLVLLIIFGSVVPATALDIVTALSNASRLINWSTNTGVSGGIPSASWTQCGATIAAYSGTAATINNAIAACPDNQFVKLGAGTFTLTTGLAITNNQQVALRGSGASTTIIKLTGSGASCTNQYGTPSACLGHNATRYFAYDGSVPTTHANWTAGYTKGTTVITLDNATNVTVGMMIILDQIQDVSDNGGAVYSSCPGGSVSQCPTFFASNEASAGAWNAWTRGLCTPTCSSSSLGNRGPLQLVRVTAKNGNNLTITPGLYSTVWRSARSPQAWFPNTAATMGYRQGIEHLTLDVSGASQNVALGVSGCYECWLNGVRFIGRVGLVEHVAIFASGRTEIRNSYLSGVSDTSTQNYGIDQVESCDTLVINNIFDRIAGALTNGTMCGTVFGYNYGANPFILNGNWQYIEYQNHGIDDFTLAESNEIDAHLADNLHGGSPFITSLRNRHNGPATGGLGNTTSVNINAMRRGTNYIGNVLGVIGTHTQLLACAAPGRAECTRAVGSGDTNNVIFAMGYANTGTSGGQVPYDPVAYTSMVRWGNWDAATQTSRFQASEVAPGGAFTFMPSVTVPDVQTIPNTLFLSESDRLQWWCSGATQGSCVSPPYPAIGPDVTGGNIPNTGGHANKLPARLCWESMVDDPNYSGLYANIRLFDPTGCYHAASGDSLPPAAPTNLRIL